MNTARVLFWDQLSPRMTALEGLNPDTDWVVMGEFGSDATYVAHHPKKLVLLWSAQRHFRDALRAQGFRVIYNEWGDHPPVFSMTDALVTLRAQHVIDQVILTHPTEWRQWEAIQSWETQLGCPVTVRPDHRFICPLADATAWLKARKTPRMSHFYQWMRQAHQVLMTPQGPVGGQWTYDQDNRHPPHADLVIPPPLMCSPDAITQSVMDMVARDFSHHVGDVHPFHYAVTHEDAHRVLMHFIGQRLPWFGTYQDAMMQDEPWMFHSHLSFYLNSGLLDPMTCIQAAVHAFEKGHAPLSSVEGFVRQLLGWREYVRAIYWAHMPAYRTHNALQATRPLPSFYWTGDTPMNCIRQCVAQTKQWAYAHHIQRLMVLGNFALLAGIHPTDVNDWFLRVYADAFEWVELPNVTGMILYADGGYLATKPYVAGGAYINKMSTYCRTCQYDVKQKEGTRACPFNYLYWDFLMRHRPLLQGNPRLGMAYRTYDRFAETKQSAIRVSAEQFFDYLDRGESLVSPKGLG